MCNAVDAAFESKRTRDLQVRQLRTIAFEECSFNRASVGSVTSCSNNTDAASTNSDVTSNVSSTANCGVCANCQRRTSGNCGCCGDRVSRNFASDSSVVLDGQLAFRSCRSVNRNRGVELSSATNCNCATECGGTNSVQCRTSSDSTTQCAETRNDEGVGICSVCDCDATVNGGCASDVNGRTECSSADNAQCRGESSS